MRKYHNNIVTCTKCGKEEWNPTPTVSYLVDIVYFVSLITEIKKVSATKKVEFKPVSQQEISCDILGESERVYMSPVKPKRYLTKIESITDALNVYFSETTVDNLDCIKCNIPVSKRIEAFILYPPQYLIVGQMRHEYSEGYAYKLDIKIKNELEIDISNYLIYEKANPKPKTKYNLIATVVHYGSLEGGHYIAYAKYQNTWYKLDDRFVVPNIDVAEVISCPAMVLFYERA